MPKLKRDEEHHCPSCDYSSKRNNLKRHLTIPKADGNPRCPGLSVVVPTDVWVNGILPYYTIGAKLTDLSEFSLTKAPPGRKRKKKMAEMCNYDKKRRLKSDGIIDASGKCTPATGNKQTGHIHIGGPRNVRGKKKIYGPPNIWGPPQKAASKGGTQNK